MQSIRPDVASDAFRDAINQSLSRQTNDLASALSSPVSNLLAEAVAPADESAALSATAQSVADLQAIIERLATAQTPEETVVALQRLQDFAEDNTNARFAGGVIGELADIAGEVINAIEGDPGALGNGFALSINADFSQSTFRSEDYTQRLTAFSFRFTLRTDNALFTGSLAFQESLQLSDEGLRYQSAERVTLGVVSLNANAGGNPLLAGFNRLTEQLTGIDLGALLGQAGAEAAQPRLGNGGYRALATIELYRVQFSQTQALVASNDTLLERLRAFLEEEPRPIAAGLPVEEGAAQETRELPEPAAQAA